MCFSFIWFFSVQSMTTRTFVTFYVSTITKYSSHQMIEGDKNVSIQTHTCTHTHTHQRPSKYRPNPHMFVHYLPPMTEWLTPPPSSSSSSSTKQARLAVESCYGKDGEENPKYKGRKWMSVSECCERSRRSYPNLNDGTRSPFYLRRQCYVSDLGTNHNQRLALHPFSFCLSFFLFRWEANSVQMDWIGKN